MVVATAGPTARAVVLEQFDERGFVFWTSSESPKGRALAGDPRVALVWLWDGRQARVEGSAEPVSAEEDEITPLHRKSLGDDVVGPWLDRPANLPAREAVIALRKGIQQVYLGLGGVNWQVGRDYPLQQVMQPETWNLLSALKHAVDPHGLMNPGSLGLRAPA